MKTVKLGDDHVGDGHPCYLIAEIGGNFIDLDQARKLIDQAAKAGVHSVKFQTFRADTLTSKKALFEMENTGTVLQHQIFQKYEISKELQRQVIDYARSRNLFVFSTPSHPSDVDLLEELGAAAHKIGSDDAINLPLLRYVAGTGKPVLLSTGMCSMEEVEAAVDAITEAGNQEIILFHCTTNYPTHPQSVNLRAMETMRDHFDFPVGYSDHTLGIDTCYAAAVMGADILEFHFTYDKKADGPDHMLSKDLPETAELVRKVAELPIIMGDGIKRPAKSEETSLRNNRKSIVITANIKSGEQISAENIAIKRPGSGISPAHWDDVLGRTADRDLSAEEVLEWDDII